MKKNGNGKGAFGRSRSGRSARQRASIGFNAGACSLLVVATGLGFMLGGPKTGAIVAGISGMIWVNVALFRAQRRSLQQS